LGTVVLDAFLDKILRGLITYSIPIFTLLGLGILIYIRKFFLGLREWQASVFGLERSIAQRKLASAATGLTLLLLLMIGEFLLITVIGPQMPSQALSVTPTIDPFASPTATLSESAGPTPTPQPTPTIGQEMLVSECVEGELEITSPEDGGEVSGTVEIIGTVNIADFGSYKYEYSTTGAVDWVTIAAGSQLKLDESLGSWFTSDLTPGTYLLQLVPLNNLGEELTSCIITVEVVPEE
jgi:hypothetical protein